jgi:hypothetical protein
MSKYVILSITVIFFHSCRLSSDENKQIRQCFATYKEAIIECQGNLGVECVDSKTINYYLQTLKKVIEYDSLQIEAEPTIDKYTILKIRQNIPYDSIIHLNAKSLLAHLINHGIAGNSNISMYDIGKVQISYDSARAEKVIGGKASNFFFRFHKENNSWKLSVFSPLEHELYNWGIKQAIIKSKLPEDLYILKYIETTSLSKAKNDLWHPLTIR